MPLSISIWFLTGRAHLHPWQTHHSEGRVEWPPSQWRLLRAFVAVAGRGLTTLPYPDEGPAATALLAFADVEGDEIPLSQLATLLQALSVTPTIWLPKTAGGHTRQYFPVHEGKAPNKPEDLTTRIVKNSGSAVFDTFATVRKDQPLVFYWPDANLALESLAALKLILGRLTYFGRAESWCHAQANTETAACLSANPQTHWECRCIEDQGSPAGKKEYRDYTLERRLAPLPMEAHSQSPCLTTEASRLFECLKKRAKLKGSKSLAKIAFATWQASFNQSTPPIMLLRCLLRESGQDIKDGLERPIGTRWVHYAVPREIYDVPRPKPQPRTSNPEAVDLVVYALNTATVHRPVLPALTDTLLVADQFRSAAMALCKTASRPLSGHETDAEPCRDHQHAFWWPRDENNDGFIDRVFVHASGSFPKDELHALRRLSRLRQRGGRPDLLVTPLYVGPAADYPPWKGRETKTFVSATPYFCPLHLTHGKTGGGRLRPITGVIQEGLRRQGITDGIDDIDEISEIVFDYAPKELMLTLQAVAAGELQEPIPPRQYFPLVDQPERYPPLPRLFEIDSDQYRGAFLKDPDSGYPFGLSVGLRVDGGTRFIRAMSFCRRRRNHQVKGTGRMFMIRFRKERCARPFAIGDQCHFGLGLFTPVSEVPDANDKFEV